MAIVSSVNLHKQSYGEYKYFIGITSTSHVISTNLLFVTVAYKIKLSIRWTYEIWNKGFYFILYCNISTRVTIIICHHLITPLFIHTLYMTLSSNNNYFGLMATSEYFYCTCIHVLFQHNRLSDVISISQLSTVLHWITVPGSCQHHNLHNIALLFQNVFNNYR